MQNAIAERDFHDIYRTWSSSIYKFSRFYFGNDLAAETATQETFVHYFQKAKSGQCGSVHLELLRCAVQTARSGIVDRRRGLLSNAIGIGAALLLLPTDERLVFILLGIINLSIEDAAAVLETSADAVNSTWTQALSHLDPLYRKTA